MAWLICKSSYHHEQLEKCFFKKQVKNVCLQTMLPDFLAMTGW